MQETEVHLNLLLSLTIALSFLAVVFCLNGIHSAIDRNTEAIDKQTTIELANYVSLHCDSRGGEFKYDTGKLICN